MFSALMFGEDLNWTPQPTLFISNVDCFDIKCLFNKLPDMIQKAYHGPRAILVSLVILVVSNASWCQATTLTFSNYVAFATGSHPEAVAIADLNDDGRKDVVMTTSAYGNSTNDNSILIFFQNAAGKLNPPVRYAAGAAVVSVAVADLNGDGRNDIAVGKTTSGIRVFWQDAQGGFTNFTDYATANAYSICAGDFNNDGRTDLACVGRASSEVDTLMQNTNGTLAFGPHYTASYAGNNQILAADVNQDGLTDLVVMSGQVYSVPNVSILLQTNGGFAPATTCNLGDNRLTTGIGVADLNGDNRNDIIVCYGGNRPTSKLSVFNQLPTGQYSLSTTNDSYDNPQSLMVADLDMDGNPDVILLHGGWNAAGVYRQTSPGTLLTEQLLTLPYASSYNRQGLAVGDINGDGRPDVVLADYNNGLVVLYNTTPAPPVRIARMSVLPGGKIVLGSPYCGAHGSSVVQRSTTLTDWTPVGTISDSTWTDTNSTLRQAFYRLAPQ